MKVYKAGNGKKKISVVAICLLLTVVMAVGGTLAYLFTSTAPVENTFQPAAVGNYVEEESESVVINDKTIIAKTNVSIENSINKNTDNLVDAYIRATVVVTWRNGNHVLPATMGSDYNVHVATGTDWVLYDGYYYHKTPVKPGENTDVLYEMILPLAEKEGYTLHVEIISQSIQAEGTAANGKTPAEIAWGVDPSTLN